MVVVIDHERHGRIEVTDHVHMLIEKDRREWVPQRTDPWYKKRREHITASTIAAICGDNPYESRVAALKKKVGTEPPFRGNAATEHGNKYEDVAIRLYEERHGEKCLEFGLLESLNPDEGYLAGSPDGITASGKLIEVKCPFRRKPNGSVPGHYIHQLQALMHMLHLDECDFIEYVPEGTWCKEIFVVVNVKRCDLFWNRIEPKLKLFWKQVMDYRENGVLPREIDKEEEEEALKKAKKRKRVITIGKKKSEAATCLIPLQRDYIAYGYPPEKLRNAIQDRIDNPDSGAAQEDAEAKTVEPPAALREAIEARLRDGPPEPVQCLIPLPNNVK